MFSSIRDAVRRESRELNGQYAKMVCLDVLYTATGISFGRPAFGASASRASMEVLDTMRLVPSFHESNIPAFISCDTRAELTPSIRAASAAVTAGMSPSSRLTATAIILPPCCGWCPKSGAGRSTPPKGDRRPYMRENRRRFRQRRLGRIRTFHLRPASHMAQRRQRRPNQRTRIPIRKPCKTSSNGE